jgi:hypothetical protein
VNRRPQLDAIPFSDRAAGEGGRQVDAPGPCGLIYRARWVFHGKRTLTLRRPVGVGGDDLPWVADDPLYQRDQAVPAPGW